MLVNFYDESKADAVVQSFVDSLPCAPSATQVPPSEVCTRYWTAIWKTQTAERRNAFRDAGNKVRNHKKGVTKDLQPSDKPDIRDWDCDDMVAHMGKLGNICVDTGMSLAVVKLSCDRIWDDSRYNCQDTAPLWTPLNTAETAEPLFATQELFKKHCQESAMSGHHIQQLVKILRVPLKRLRDFHMTQL
jgi:hypothetical protein